MCATKILGIDPGRVNFGWCLLSSDSNTPIAHGVERLPFVGDVRGHDAKVAAAVAAVLSKIASTADLVVVEQQMRREYYVISGAVLGYALGTGKRVHSFAPAPVKRHFGIAPSINYETRKQRALDKAAELGAAFSTDHEADAYLTARYAVDILKLRN
jgi:Holliday junction resolvasome RuvABC endonuclease subunit